MATILISKEYCLEHIHRVICFTGLFSEEENLL